MKISTFGGIIAAANEKRSFPLHKIGRTTAITQIVNKMQQAGIFPIVVLSSAEDDAVRYQLSTRGVVFLQPKADETELFTFAKMGFSFLQDCCENIIFAPVNTPLFSLPTLSMLMQSGGDIVTPSYHGKGGHPMMLSSKRIPDILAYKGNEGLRGAVSSMEHFRKWVEVEDDGIIYTICNEDIPPVLLNHYSQESIYLSTQLCLKGDTHTIFDARTKLLLFLIWKNNSVKTACEQMVLSYSKAWDILNALESSMAIQFVNRRHGGTKGGRTSLSEQGLRFLIAYQEMEEDVFQYSKGTYERLQAILER